MNEDSGILGVRISVRGYDDGLYKLWVDNDDGKDGACLGVFNTREEAQSICSLIYGLLAGEARVKDHKWVDDEPFGVLE